MKLLLDACVLYPTVIRNLLISVSGKQKWDLIWTEQIFEEWRRASNKINLEAKAQTEAEIAILKSKYPKSMVNDYEKQIPKLYLPDKNDIHVLAAAIEGKASSIVTLNLRDFPNYELKKYGIRAVHPDELLYREALENFNLISGFVISILNDFNKSNANKLSEYRLLKKAKLNRLSKLFR
jgi:predicted nucleic acid-binding protein|tara:strand:+ start:171 stop:710 length:540 start_codon:yes stop_codon:yes gene_type:complete